MTPAERLAAAKKKARPKKGAVWLTSLVGRREALGLSQRDVAAAVGVSPGGYHQIETGQTDPMLSHALQLAEFFGCSISDLWTRKV